MSDPQDKNPPDRNDRLESDDLAALIVDALLRAGIVKPQDVQRAVRIATEELEVRKCLGDL